MRALGRAGQGYNQPYLAISLLSPGFWDTSSGQCRDLRSGVWERGVNGAPLAEVVPCSEGCLDSGRLQEVTALMPCSLELRRQQLLSHQLLPGLSPPDLGNRESDFALRLLPKAGGLPEKGPSGSMESGIPGPRPRPALLAPRAPCLRW